MSVKSQMNLTHPCPLAMYRPPSNDCPKLPRFRTTRSRVCVLYGIGLGACNTSVEAASKQAHQVELSLIVLMDSWKHAAAWVEICLVRIDFAGLDQLV
jgi:hypothetical protein